MRLIDADAIKYIKDDSGIYGFDLTYRGNIESMPTVDAVHVVRCKKCKYWDGSVCEVHSEWPDQYSTGHMDYTEADDFCSYGERRGNETD